MAGARVIVVGNEKGGADKSTIAIHLVTALLHEGARVHFADLDLTHADGIAMLYRRLKGAAETVCALQDGRDLGSQMRYKTCWQSALGAAVSKVDRPALTAYYRAQFNGRNATIQIAQK